METDKLDIRQLLYFPFHLFESPHDGRFSGFFVFEMGFSLKLNDA